VYGTLGMVLMEQSRAADAAALLAEGIARFPNEARLRRGRIVALSRAGQPTIALREARRLLVDTPNDAALYALVGDISTELGATQDAEDAFRQALVLQPAFPRIMNNLAWLMRDNPARRGEAIAMARRSLAIDPASAATWDTLAELLFMTGDIKGALAAITQAEARAGDDQQKAFYAERRAKYRAARSAP
jgi:predicted Zn-dependent protease